MKRFKFRLEPVEKLHRSMVAMYKSELAGKIAELEKQQHLLEQMEEERKSYSKTVSESMKEERYLLPGELEQQSNAGSLIDSRIAEQEENVRNSEAICEEAKLKLLEAEKERAALEKLRQRAYSQYKTERKRHLLKQDDFVTATRWNNKKHGMKDEL